MRNRDTLQALASSRPRSGEASSIHWDVPQEHIEQEDELADYRHSGFHDPVRLRARPLGPVLAEGAHWDY